MWVTSARDPGWAKIFTVYCIYLYCMDVLLAACSVKTGRNKEKLGPNCQTKVIKTLITPDVSYAPLKLWVREKKRSGASFVAGYQLSPVSFVLTWCSWTQHTPGGRGLPFTCEYAEWAGRRCRRSARPSHARGGERTTDSETRPERAEQSSCLSRRVVLLQTRTRQEGEVSSPPVPAAEKKQVCSRRRALVWFGFSRAIFGGGGETVSSWL